MSEKKDLELTTPPADFEILASSFYTIAQEMGLNIERTAKSPVFFSAHDYVVTINKIDGDIISMAEYIPVLVGSTPFAVKGTFRYYKEVLKEDIDEGDIFLCSDIFTLDCGNQPQDWCIVTPVFYQGEPIFVIAVKAHQADIGGGAPGGYNPNAMDCWAEGLRIPPVKIYERGKRREDVLRFVTTNVRTSDMCYSDLLCMASATQIGAKRLIEMLDYWGEEKVLTYIDDVFNYAEHMIREQITRIPDGTYRSEVNPTYQGRYNDAAVIRCEMTVKGDDMTLDFTKTDPQVREIVNSSIANTYSSIWLAILTSLGKDIRREYRNSGCFRPISIMTKPGTIVHAQLPATCGNDTNFVAKQIIEAVWKCLAQTLPTETPAGWGSIPYWTIGGYDPRWKRYFGTPDFLGTSCGAGAIWGTDGWSANSPVICSGTLYYPEIEIVELAYPIVCEKWEFAADSEGAGKWRGGLGMWNIWVADAEFTAAYCVDPYEYEIGPAIAGGQIPKPNEKKIVRKDGTVIDHEECRRIQFFTLEPGDRIIDYLQGGCGVGDPLERDVEAVLEDLREGKITVERARKVYGVVITGDPEPEVDMEATEKLREDLKKRRK